jgi:alpha-L-fucosidase 2
MPNLMLFAALLGTSVCVLASARDQTAVEFARPDGKPLYLDLRVPDGSGPYPAAILVHGGGFDQGSRTTNVRPLFQPLTDAGFAWFTIDYRLAPEAHLEQAVADLRHAIEWVRGHASEYKIDPAKLVLIGESAGAYLVNYQGTHETPGTKVAAVVDFYGPSDYGVLAKERQQHPERFNMSSINGHAAHGGGIHYFGVETLDDNGMAKLHALSPIAGVHQGMPPFLCIHGTKDDQVSYSQTPAFCERIRSVGGTCDIVTVEGGGHGMSVWKDASMQNWKPEMIAWLKKTLQID